ncbi:hypothetical protein CROQUDRAFT_720448 [Cronartium quercuum f. sp. fusiforme G11]|uniref:Uncharacterized protein n=1 Tax=Cronartium quercuum f. sp. fusiforme G11 TaxID=708437 RepID=A0A9P6NRV6_9BASI|nr:hypothetical protein CROQUDRAFT_720448 [Cronartium quercuum f. sp. fusiforme G11]
MPLGSRLNLEVGCKTWRFNPDDHPNGGPPKRGGQFESPTRTRSSRHSINVDRNQTEENIGFDTPRAALEKKQPSAESIRLNLEKKALEVEKARIEDMAQRAAAEQQRIEEMAQQAAIEKARIEEMHIRAAEQESLRIEHQERIEQEKQRMLFEADQRLQRLREQVAEVEEKHRAELAYWEERERRAVLMEAEAEARAKAREEAEEARAIERARALELERTAGLERLRNEAREEYRRAHEEVRRVQEEQLRKEVEEVRRVQEEQLRREVEEARRKIAEETAMEKLALEKERQTKLAQMKEEMQLEIQKCRDEGLQWYRESGEEFKEVAATVTRNFKIQELQALRNLYSAAGDRYLPADPTVTQSAPATTNTIPLDGPIPSDLSPTTREKWISYRREARRRGLLEGVGLYPPQGQTMARPDDWNSSGRLSGRVIGLSSGSVWGTPSVRQRANSTGQNTLPTPFVAGSSLMNQEPTHRMGTGSSMQFSKNLSAAGPSGGMLSGRPSYLNYAGWGAPTGRPMRNAGAHEPAPMRNNVGGGGVGHMRASYGTHHDTGVQRGYPGSGPGPGDQDEDDGQFCVVTVQVIPGFEYERIFGEVYGCTLRDIPNFPPAHHMTIEAQEMMRESAMIDRRTAVEDLIRRAKSMGANGVIGLSFHTNPISQTSCEVVAAATAVKLVASDKMAVFPSNVEHATRTAHENERQGHLGTRPNGRGNENEGQKKKNKGKGKQSEENEDQEQGVTNQNGEGRNNKKNKQQQQQQQQKQQKQSNNNGSEWNAGNDGGRWNKGGDGGCDDDDDDDDEDEDDNSAAKNWNQSQNDQCGWGQSQDNQGGRSQPLDNASQGGRKGGEKNMSKKEKKKAAQQNQQEDNYGVGGNDTWANLGWAMNNNNNNNNDNQSRNSNFKGWKNCDQTDDDCNQRSNNNYKNNNNNYNNNNNNKRQQNTGRDNDQNPWGGPQKSSNMSGNNGQQQRGEKSNQNLNGHQNQWNRNQNRDGRGNDCPLDNNHNHNNNGNNGNNNSSNGNNNNGNGFYNNSNGFDNNSNGFNNNSNGSNNNKKNGQDSWRNHDQDNEWGDKKKNDSDKQNQDSSKKGGKGNKGGPPSQAEIARRKEEAQKNKFNNNGDKNTQKQNKKGKQPRPPPPDDDEDEDEDGGLIGGAFEFANCYQPTISYSTHAVRDESLVLSWLLTSFGYPLFFFALFVSICARPVLPLAKTSSIFMCAPETIDEKPTLNKHARTHAHTKKKKIVNTNSPTRTPNH